MATASPVCLPSSPVNVTQPEGLECCVCKEERRYLKKIPCRHLFCEYCLESIVITATNKRFSCPICRAVTNVPRGGASGFPISGLRQVLDAELDVSIYDQGLSAECHSCGIDVNGKRSFSCVRCKVILCNSDLCHDYHLENGHHLVLRTDLSPAVDSQTCFKHGHGLQHYCLTCLQLLCESCLRPGAHRHHKVEGLKQSSQRAKEHLEMARSHIEPSLRHLDWVHKNVKNSRRIIERQKQAIEKKIRDRAQEARHMVQELENAALASLGSITREMEQQYCEEESDVNTKLCALRFKRECIASTLAKGSDICLVRLDPSACDMIRKPELMKKFTWKLPDIVQCPRVHNDSSPEALRTVMKKYIGSPVVEKTKRKVPVMKPVSEFQLRGPSDAFTFRVCSGGTNLLVWVSSTSHNQNIGGSYRQTLELVDMSDLKIVKHDELTNDCDQFDVVNIDEEHVITNVKPNFATNRGDDTLTLFCKGKLQSCLKFSKVNCQIMPSVSTSEEVFKGSQGFNITGSCSPVSMDRTSSGGIFAVVTSSYQLDVYHHGATRPYSTYPSSKSGNKSAKIVDACFFTFGKHEVLLLADKTQEDVEVMDVVHGCRMVGFLTNSSGELAHPLALNRDPFTGYLLVLCAPREDGGALRLVVCKPTGIPVNLPRMQVLGKFW